MNQMLRPMVDSDLPLVLSWRNAKDVRNNMYTNHVITPDEHQAWWNAQSIDPATRLLIYEMDSQPLGVVTFTKFTGEAGSATWAFYSGDRSHRGVGKLMEIAALEYAFEALRVCRLECEVLAFNKTVVDFHIKHGFTVEGIFRQAYIRDGEYYDIYRLSMLSDEWFKHVKSALASTSSGGNSLVGKCFSIKFDVSDKLVNDFSIVTGDKNPIHLDDVAAKSLGFPGRIAHGMLIGSVFSKFFANNFPGPGTVYLSQSLEFVAPLPVGAHADVRLKVLAHIGRKLLVETQVFEGDKICVTGQAKLMLPKHQTRHTSQ